MEIARKICIYLELSIHLVSRLEQEGVVLTTFFSSDSAGRSHLVFMYLSILSICCQFATHSMSMSNSGALPDMN